jgi:hypothetical protein
MYAAYQPLVSQKTVSSNVANGEDDSFRVAFVGAHILYRSSGLHCVTVHYTSVNTIVQTLVIVLYGFHLCDTH